MIRKETTSQNSPETEDQYEKKKISPFGLQKNMIWIIIANLLILALAILFLFILLSGSGATVSPQTCGERVIQYINVNLVVAGTNASLISVTEDKGVYTIKTVYQSQEIDTYATKDCTMLFMGNIDMTDSQVARTIIQNLTPVKSARPAVDLYVMAFCPYGTQAESTIKPVIDLLGATADFRIRYIATIENSTVDSVQSLHGASEVGEDLRQICIQSYYPETFWTYLMNFNTQCYPQWQNSTFLASCGNQTSENLGINTRKIMTCSQSDEGLALLKEDENNSHQNNAYGSPTLIINGVTYRGIRTSEAYKQAICNSYDVVPSACNITLSTQESADASRNCG